MKFNIEDAFISCGNQHKYQKIILIAILFIWLSVDFVSIIFPLFELEPKYQCLIDNQWIECENNLACNWSQDKVHRISDYKNILTDFNIDCDKLDIILLGVSYTSGILIGSFLASIYSDLYGRKTTLIVSEFIFFSSCILLVNSPDYKFVLIAVFFCGVSCSGGTIISYMYINEILKKEKRSVYGVSISIFFSLAGFIYFFCFQKLKNWIHLTYICIGFNLISFVMIVLYLVESPRYYYSCNRFQASLEAFYEIATKNGKKEDFEFFIKKSYWLFIQGKNKDFYFDDLNIEKFKFDENDKVLINNHNEEKDENKIGRLKVNREIIDNENPNSKTREIDKHTKMKEDIESNKNLDIGRIFENLKKYENESALKERNADLEYENSEWNKKNKKIETNIRTDNEEVDIKYKSSSSSSSIGENTNKINSIKDSEKEKVLSQKTVKLQKKTSSYFSLLKYKSLRSKFLICNLIWFTYAFSYYGISFYLKKGKYEVFIDGYIVYTAELISVIIAFFIMSSKFFGRVKTLNIMMILSGISTLCFYFFRKNNSDYDKIPLFISRFAVTALNSTMYAYSTESYPTIIRAKGLGVNIFFARVACCLVPIIIEIIDNPFLIFSVLCFFTSIFTFFLPETLNQYLEDEILEEKEKSLLLN